LLLLGSAIMAGSAHAQAARGWFWYDDPPPEPEVKPQPKPTPKPKPPEKAPEPKQKASETAKAPEEPPPLSTAWLRKKLPEYLDRAIDDPTPENVGAYLALQKVMFDKSHNFAAMSPEALRRYPALDPTAFVPTDAAGLANFDAYVAQVRPVAIRKVLDKAGLFFFYDTTCAFCVQQAEQLAQFKAIYPGASMLGIAADGKALTGTPLKIPLAPDRGQIKTLGVQMYPSIALVWPPNNFAFVAQGAVNVTKLETNILQVAAEHGLLEPEYVAWVKPYERGVLTPLQIRDAAKAGGFTSPDTVRDFVSQGAFNGAARVASPSSHSPAQK
jgi:conjugal transfer pilus assembly protein TraF